MESLYFIALAFLAHELPLWAYQVFCSYLHHNRYLEKYRIQASQYPSPELLAKARRHIFIKSFV